MLSITCDKKSIFFRQSHLVEDNVFGIREVFHAMNTLRSNPHVGEEFQISPSLSPSLHDW